MESLTQTENRTALCRPSSKTTGTLRAIPMPIPSEAAEALFLLNVGTTDAAIGSTDAATPPLIEECDTTGGSYTAVTGAALAAVLGQHGDDNKQFANPGQSAEDAQAVHAGQRPARPRTQPGRTCRSLCILGQLAHSTLDAAGMGLASLVEA